jgi:predicted phage tail protein
VVIKSSIRAQVFIMLREVKLYSSLAKAAGTDVIQLNVDTQQHLFAALKAHSTSLDMTLRTTESVYIVATDENGENAVSIEPGFGFSSTAKQLHIASSTSGAFPLAAWAIWDIVLVVVMVAVVVISSMLINKLNGTNNSTGAKSTMFNGPVNSTDQGGAIPIICGKKVLVGSTIISVAEDYYNVV